ncbi:hypothetical protein [uncultured Acetobacterium sp.]|uniref:hypothetical protein n=1 Tax=uncultured Acetobacterium sp. TaxID=217139 RepID=UPI0025D10048|nr:hypothetical protein [uncultured Acetobacterium sp.]
MQVILYLPILVLSIVSAFVVFSKVKMMFFGSNMLDLGLGIIGAWFFIFFVCVSIWTAIFVYLGIPILIIGAILLAVYFVLSKCSGNAADVESEDGQPAAGMDEETAAERDDEE